VSQPRTPWHFPWGPLLTVAGLALFVLLLHRGRPGLSAPAPWPILAAVATAAAMAYLVLRRLVSPFWGVAAGVVLAIHPYSWKWMPPMDLAQWAQALQLVVLAGVVTAGRLAFLSRGSFLGWVALFVWLSLGISLSWLVLPTAGAIGVLLTGVTLPVFAGLASRQRRRPGLSVLPSRWNVFGAIVVGVLAVCAGTLLAPLAVPHLDGMIRTRLTPEMSPWEMLKLAAPAAWGWHLPGLTRDELRLWCWPTEWAVLPLMAWGLWCTLSRGWKQSARRQPPLAWLLTLYCGLVVAGMALHPAEAPDMALLPWAVLSVLLGVFCVGDTLRTMWERIRLVPPHERDLG
jgi:hypothetical protein